MKDEMVLGPANADKLTRLQQTLAAAEVKTATIRRLLDKRQIELEQTQATIAAVDADVEPAELAKSLTLRTAQQTVIAQVETALAEASAAQKAAKDELDNFNGWIAGKRTHIAQVSERIAFLEAEKADVVAQLAK